MPVEHWRSSIAPRLLFYALIVLGYLFLCRWVIVYHSQAPSDGDAIRILLGAAQNFGLDALAVAVVTLAAVALARVSAIAAATLFIACAAVLMSVGAINVRVMSIYQQPATINLFKYGNFLNLDGLGSLAKYLTTLDLVLVAFAITCLLSFALARGIERWSIFERPMARRLVGIVALIALVAMPAYGLLTNQDDHRGRHSNAAWWLLKSTVAPPSGKVAQVRNPDLRDPFDTYDLAEAEAITTAGRVRQAGIRNVLLIVLESVGSEYLDLDRDPLLAPNLSRLRTGAAYFPNTYAAMPSSPMSLFSLMTGMYPPVSPVAIPMGEPNFPATTMFEQLGSAGKRTGAFSANWGFMDFAGYLGSGGVGHVQELADERRCGVLAASGGQSSSRHDQPLATEKCTFASLRNWIAQSDQDFFALLWTYGSHYPYGADPAAIAADPGLARARYLAAITRTDALIGELIAWLDAAGRLDDTLVVLVGDHGQSFSQHGNRVHGNDVYLESIRVPLVLVNRRLFSGVTDPSPVRLIDVPPTLLGIAGAGIPATMQGLDLSTPSRPRRLFFSAAWLNLVMGYQERHMKYNYAFITDHLEAFDLASDPHERVDLGPRLSAAERASIVRRIMNWKSAVDANIAAARAPKPRAISTSPAAAGSSGSRRCCRRS